jgi:hypothetical protein
MLYEATRTTTMHHHHHQISSPHQPNSLLTPTVYLPNELRTQAHQGQLNGIRTCGNRRGNLMTSKLGCIAHDVSAILGLGEPSVMHAPVQ